MPDFNSLSSIKSKIKADEEKKQRGLTFARLYLANKEYNCALTSINDYLSVKNNSSEAYKLLGETYEALNNIEKAIESYKKSYFIDKNQDNLLFKICDKLSTLDNVDTQTIKTWLERLERKYPNHQYVFNLKDKLQLENGNNRLDDTFRDISNIKLSDLTDDKCANLSCSFLNTRSPSTNQIKSLERGQDRILKKVNELEENFNKTTTQLVDLVNESKKMFDQLKNEVDKINTALGKLQLGQQEMKQSIDDFINGGDEDYNDEEDDEEDTDVDESNNENNPTTNLSFLSCNSTTNNQQNTSDVFSRLGPTRKPASDMTVVFSKDNNSFVNNSPQQQTLLFGKPQPLFQSPQQKQSNISQQQQQPINQSFGNLQITKNKPTLPQPVFGNNSASSIDKNTPSSSNTSSNKNAPLSELYKDQFKNKWSCPTCYNANDNGVEFCPSCETRNPNTNAPSSSNTSSNKNAPLSELYKDQFKNKWSCQTCYNANDNGVEFCPSCETRNPNLPPVEEKQQTTSSPFQKPPQIPTFAQKLAGTFSTSSSTDNKFVFGGLSSLNTTTSAAQSTTNKVTTSGFTFSTNSIFNQPATQPILSKPIFPLQPTNQLKAPTSNPLQSLQQLGQTPFPSSTFVFGNSSANTSAQSNQSVFNMNAPKLSSPVLSNKLSTPSSISSTSSISFPTIASTLTKNAPTPISQNTTDTASTAEDQALDDIEAEAPIDFKPVIPLPPKVDVVTGEENEIVLFTNRAKLHIFTNSEWKERGLGDIKILHDEGNNRYRILMRRDQVHKVCLNTPIMKEFKFLEQTNKQGTLIKFVCVDFSEEVGVPQTLTLKFKQKEIADKFKEEVNKIVVNILKSGDADVQKNVEETKNEAKDEVKKETEKEIKEDDEIEIVYVKEPKLKDYKERAEKLFLPINFFSYLDAKPCPGCRGCNDEIPKLNFELESNNENEKNLPAENNSNTNYLFSSVIASTINSSANTSWLKSSEPPSWMKSALTPLFSNQQSNNSSVNPDDPEAEIVTLDFKPIIPLPDLIEVKTGEENEDVLFSCRGKLYVFTNPEWKERGVGEFKILKHKETKRIRFLMRRDQVHKLCLNHMVDKGIKIGLRAGRNNIYQWTATDFSDNETGTPRIFNLKIKNEDLGRELIKCLETNVDGFVEDKPN